MEHPVGTENQNNRSTAMTPEIIGQVNTDMLAVCKESFEAGVKAGTIEVILTDAQVDVLALALIQAAAVRVTPKKKKGARHVRK